MSQIFNTPLLKKISRRDFIKLGGLAGVSMVFASCKPIDRKLNNSTPTKPSTPIITKTPTIEPTVTFTLEPTSSPTPEPTPTEVVPPQEILTLAEKLGEGYRVEYREEEQKFALVQHVEYQQTDTETVSKDVDAVKYSADGKTIYVDVDGEEKEYQISGKNAHTIDVPKGEDKYFFNLDITPPEQVGGEAELRYTQWGYWVENKEKQIGGIIYNPSKLNAGEFRISDELVDYNGEKIPAYKLMQEKFYEVIYNTQKLLGDEDLLHKFFYGLNGHPERKKFHKEAIEFMNTYPTYEVFRQAITDEETFTLYIPKKFPMKKVPQLSDTHATVEIYENISLNEMGFEVRDDSRSHILDCQSGEDSDRNKVVCVQEPDSEKGFSTEWYNVYKTARLRVDVQPKGENKKQLNWVFKRGEFYYPLDIPHDSKTGAVGGTIYPNLLDIGTKEERQKSAETMVKGFLEYCASSDFRERNITWTADIDIPQIGFMLYYKDEMWNNYSKLEDPPNFIALR